jgi:O-methyltransferase
MFDEDFTKLIEDLEEALLTGARGAAIIGLTVVTTRILSALAGSGLIGAVEAVYAPLQAGSGKPAPLAVPVHPLAQLGQAHPDVVIVADDVAKEDLLIAALPYLRGTPKVIVAGYGHLKFRNPIFEHELASLLVPSLANGYPNSLVHLFECLANAAKLSLSGVVAEFGMFKGGTTMFMSRVIERLGKDWKVIGFDTFSGFPPRRSPLDMYDNAECTFSDIAAVTRYLAGRNIEIVTGDIVDTCSRLDGEQLVVSFVDTDNFSSAEAAIAMVRERTVVGGAIVFDHFTGVDRFRYTLGERIAGRVLLADARFFHLHDTGVFLRQR